MKINVLPSEWRRAKLEVLTTKIGSGITPRGGRQVYKSSGIPFLRSQNVGWGRLLLDDIVFIDSKVHSTFLSTELQLNDVLLNITGASIGRCSIITESICGGNVNQHVCILRPKINELIPDFLCAFILSGSGQKLIDSFQAGGNRQGLNFEQIKSFPIPLPPLPEQRAIANILSTWGTAIQSTQALIAQKEQEKKWLMQNLLTGKKRLPAFANGEAGNKGVHGEWKEVTLGEVFTERNERGSDDSRLLSIGQDGVYPQSDSVKKDTSNSDKSKYKLILPGDIGYNTMRMWQGRSALSDLEGIVSPAYTIVTPKENADAEFFSYLFQTPKVINLFWRNSQGLVSDTLNCKFKDFSLVKIKLASIEEQKAIAQVLQTADKEITLLKSKLEQQKLQKKGLMQVLLTGKVRVKV